MARSLLPKYLVRSTFAAVLALAAVAAHAAPFTGSVLGIDNSKLYAIDLATGLATGLESLAGHGVGDVNALAYDPSTKSAYFQRDGDLWSVDLLSHAFAKTAVTIGGVDDATFYNGAYYFATGSALKRVDLATKSVSTVETYDKGWSFGDIATSGAMLYGSSGSSLFSIDMGTKAYAPISTHGKQLQLGFVGTDLYGIANGNASDPAGTIYGIDTATGALATGSQRVHDASGYLAIRDAATLNPVPEPSAFAAVGVGVLGLLRRRNR